MQGNSITPITNYSFKDQLTALGKQSSVDYTIHFEYSSLRAMVNYELHGNANWEIAHEFILGMAEDVFFPLDKSQGYTNTMD